MSSFTPPLDDAALKIGLLMESAQTHQKMAESELERLRSHTESLDTVVREVIRRTLIEELADLGEEGKRAAQSLQRLKYAANQRFLLWSVVLAVLCTAIPAALMRYAMPSNNQIAALQSESDRLTLNIKRLEREGGRIDWRHCGEAARLCVRVDRGAPAYGAASDYFVVEGF